MLKLGVFSLTIAILAACGVYALKHRVQGLERELRHVERQIEREQVEIKRLNAEWATLSRPGRLTRLAERHLGLRPTEPRQIATIADVPLRNELDQDGAPALVSSVTLSGGRPLATTNR